MKFQIFASRNLKEILRDPLTLGFGIGFPLVVLLLLSAIQANIPVDMFAIERLTPGIAVFGLSFFSLFAGILISKDRATSFLMRLFASPLTASDYILSYTLPVLLMAVAQIFICFIAAAILGLEVNFNALLAVVVVIPAAILFIAIGLLTGSLFNDKQVGGIIGAGLTNFSAWLSGTWFEIELVGGWFKKIADALPFSHAVEAGRAAMRGDFASILPHLWWVIGYALITLIIAIVVFTRKMKSDQV